MRTLVRGAATALSMMLLVACGGNDPGAGDVAATDPAAATVTVATSATGLGTVLVDGDGMTLYVFDQDEDGRSTCTGGCADTWPPLVGEATAGDGVDASLVGTTARPDGASQVTYDGRPLYHYAPDSGPGETSGQGVGGVWWVVSPDGTAVTDAPSPTEDGYDPYGY